MPPLSDGGNLRGEPMSKKNAITDQFRKSEIVSTLLIFLFLTVAVTVCEKWFHLVYAVIFLACFGALVIKEYDKIVSQFGKQIGSMEQLISEQANSRIESQNQYDGIVAQLRKQLGSMEQSISRIEFQKPKRKTSYKIELSLVPNWDLIIEDAAKDNGQNGEEFLKDLTSNLNFELDKDNSLYWHKFGFVIFQDGVSGMQQIWSNYHKRFVESIHVYGEVFALKNAFLDVVADKKYEKNRLSNHFRITPTEVEFGTSISLSRRSSTLTLSTMPFWEILQFFKYVGQIDPFHIMRAVTKFPSYLEKKLNEHGIVYKKLNDSEIVYKPMCYGWLPCDDHHECNCMECIDDLNKAERVKELGFSLSDKGVSDHIFEAKYFSIELRFEVFKSPETQQNESGEFWGVPGPSV